MKFLKKLNLTVVVFCVCCIAFVAFLTYNPSLAYFQVQKDAFGVNTAKVDLLFDKYETSVFTLENNEDSLAEENRTYKGPELDQNAEWGTEKNPYIIRKKNHINNLAMLHKAGYFNNKAGQSYFVVCDLVGKPVAINCSEDAAMEIAPIGTPNNPFTGNINGAYIAETATYTLKLDDTTSKTYTVSQSTIANLTITATEETPDVGFFGRLGFVGKKQNETDGSISIVADGTKGPYSATINNVLFADIAVKNNVKVSNLSTWWGNFTGYDAAYEKCNETHHVGIVAGHVEFATLTNISVYYTPNKAGTQAHVAAFELAGDTATNSTDKNNYYSITGILGTVVYVNPAVGEGGSLNSAPAISDPQLSEELLSGGGGGTSGMLTGYMLAENIFDRKDDDNTMTLLDAYAEAYDVRNITENEEPIFSSVVMPERKSAAPGVPWVDKTYYYFADTVFTFAMAATEDIESSPNNTGNIDYILKIWETSSEPARKILSPNIILTNEAADWSGQQTGETAYLHELKLVGTAENATLEAGSAYVLAYREEENGFLYTFDMESASSGFVKVLSPYSGQDLNGRDFISSDNVIYALDLNDSYCSYSFIYRASSESIDDTHYETMYKGLTSPNGSNVFALQAAKPTSSNSHTTNFYGDLSTALLNSTTSKHDLFAARKDSVLVWLDWTIQLTSNGATVGGNFYHRNGYYNNSGTGNGFQRDYITTYSPQIIFDTNINQFSILGISPASTGYIDGKYGGRYGITPVDIKPNDVTNMSFTEEGMKYPSDPPSKTSNQKGELLLYKVTTLKIADLTARDILPSDSSLAFDASTHVLFCDPIIRNENEQNESFNERLEAAQSYELTPLINKQWNDGRGQYLRQLNHVVKMAKPTVQNYQFNFSETPLGQWFGSNNSMFDTNTGGVVLVPLGTTGINFTMPAGTIAFYINKASVDDPSEINIIVAVGETFDKETTIGLWSMPTATANYSFDIFSPDQAFILPVSERTNVEDNARLTHIKGYYAEGSSTLTSGKNNAGYYTYLGGEVAFVGATFKVTKPGVYLLAPATGTMSVAYFSVSGAAGYGGDGTGGSPLGDIDFVYDNNNGTVITVDKKFQEGTHSVPDESLTDTYYPSYYYLRMLPNTEDPKTENGDGIIRNEKVYVRRYTVSTPPKIGASEADRKRIIQMSCTDTDTHLMGLSAIFQDINYANIGTSS